MNVFQIQLPKVGNDGTDNSTHIRHILQSISKIAGGATATEAQGYWQDDAGMLVVDQVVNVQTYCDDGALLQLRSLVNYWRGLLDQDALVTSVWSANVVKYSV
jgi:hypothetical protein